MDAQELTLHIAVNLGRIGRWALAGNKKRIDQFLKETETYIDTLSRTPQSKRFQPTFITFKKKFDILKTDNRLDADWAEEVLTWANILTHRAQLA